MDNHLLDGFVLDGISVEPLSGQYDGPTRTGHLGPRAVEVLLCLARNARHLVTRQELLERVWGDGQGSADALSHAISELRHAFDDHANAPRFIQTVPRRGYRLLVEPVARTAWNDVPGSVQAAMGPSIWSRLVRHGVIQASAAYLVFGWLLIQVADATFENLGLPDWSDKFVTFVVIGGFPLVVLLSWFLEMAGGRMVRDHGQQPGGWLKGLERNYLAIVAAYGLAVFGAGLYHLTIGFESIRAASETAVAEVAAAGFIPVDKNSVAVLRFQSFDDDSRTEAFSAGLSEDILDRLAMVGALSVSSRGDAWSLPSDPESALVRRRLRVAHYVEGSVRLAGGEIRVVAQLIDSETGRHIVSRSFDRRIDDFMAVQKEITQLIIWNLRAALQDDTDVPVLSVDDADIDAYLLYRQGREAMLGTGTRDDLDLALAKFDQALSLDPKFSVAHAGRCRVFIDLYNLELRPAHIDNARNACAEAQASGGRFPDVYVAIGDLNRATGELAAAETAYQVALELNEREVSAMVGLAEIYQHRQHFDEAEGLFARAIDLQPGNWLLVNSLGALEFRRGQYDEAAEHFQQVVFLNPDNHVLLNNLGSTQILAGEFESARKTIEASLKLRETDAGYSNLGIIYYCEGDFALSAEYHRKAIEIAPRSPVTWANLADSLYFADQRAEAELAYARANELARSQLSVNSSDVEALYVRAWAEAMSGSIADAEALAAQAVGLAPGDPYAHYYEGLVKVRAGKLPDAARSIARAAELGYPKSMLIVEPHLAALRSTAEFASLLDRSAG